MGYSLTGSNPVHDEILMSFTFHSGVKFEKKHLDADECTSHLLSIIWTLSYDSNKKNILCTYVSFLELFHVHNDQNKHNLDQFQFYDDIIIKRTECKKPTIFTPLCLRRFKMIYFKGWKTVYLKNMFSQLIQTNSLRGWETFF